MDFEQFVLAHEPAIRLSFFVGVFAVVALWELAAHFGLVRLNARGRSQSWAKA